MTNDSTTGSAGFTILSPLLTLNPTTGYVASNSTAIGSGFHALAAVNLTFNGTKISSCESGSSLTANRWGNFSCTFQVPAFPADELNHANASDEFNSAIASYTITPPTLVLTPTGGPVGSAVVATGVGYYASHSLSLTFGSETISQCHPGSLSASSFGDLDCTFAVPILTAGTYQVNVSDGVNSASPASFVIGSPSLVLSVTHGPVGTRTAVTGSGFSPDAPVTLTFNSTALTGCVSGGLLADSSGDFSCTVPVPASTTGTQTFRANDTVNSATATFVVVANLTLSPANGSFGENITAIGTGFEGSSTVTVQWNSTDQLCQAQSAANGTSSCSFLVPNVVAGPHTITATDGHSTASATLKVVPVIFVSPPSVLVGQVLTAAGYGFEPSGAIAALWNHVTPECPGLSSGAIGSATCMFVVPPSVGGENNVSFVQGTYDVNRSVIVTPSFAISPGAGVVGSSVVLTGTGLASMTSYLTCLQTSLVSCSSGTSVETDSNGSIPAFTNFTIPSASPGAYDVILSLGSTIVGLASFVVTTANVELAPSSGPVGTAVTFSGSGFASDTVYAYCFQAPVLACPETTLTSFESTGSGGVPSDVPPIVVAATPGGSYYVDVSEGTDLIGAGEFSVVSNFAGNVTKAIVGDTVVADGTGFAAAVSYSVSWNSNFRLCAGSTNSTGGLNCSFTVPPAAKGAHEISAMVGGEFAAFNLSVLPSAALQPGSGKVGTSVEVSGAGFDAETALTSTWNTSLLVCSARTNVSGSFVCSFAVPPSPAGTEPVSITEGANVVNLTFIVTAAIAVAPGSGSVGSLVELLGTGLDAKASYQAYWNSSTPLCSGSTNGTGGFECTFTVPSAPKGPNTIVTDEASNAPTAVFLVLPTFALSPYEGLVGGRVVALATGFDAEASYTISWNASTQICGGSANANGEFSCNFTVPIVPAGAYSLIATEGGSTVTAQFMVVPSFALTLSNGPVGTAVDVVGTGFGADKSFSVGWNSSTAVCAGTTGWDGSLACAFVVPSSPGGPHPVVVTEGSFELSTSFEIVSSISVTPSSAMVGTNLTVVGDGFAADEAYSVSWTPTGTLCSGITNTNGVFVCTFVVPSVPPGTYTITGAQGTISLTCTLFINSTAVSSPSTSSLFPLWLIVLLVVGALLGAYLIYRQTRSRPPRRPSPLRAWNQPGAEPARPPGERPSGSGENGEIGEAPNSAADEEDLYTHIAEIRELIRKQRPPGSD